MKPMLNLQSIRKLTVVTSLAGAIATHAQVVTFSFTGAAGDEATFAPDAQPANGTVSSISRGSGLTPVATADVFNSSGFSTTTRDTSDYYSVSIEPELGYTMSLTRIELDERRSGTGIRDWSIYSSIDGFTSALASFNVPDNTSTRLNQGVNLNAISFSNLASPVEFRIYGFTSEAIGGTWRVDNLQLFGSFDATPVPEPSTYAGFAGALLLGFGVWRRSRRS
jgi:hypothetical protein